MMSNLIGVGRFGSSVTVLPGKLLSCLPQLGINVNHGSLVTSLMTSFTWNLSENDTVKHLTSEDFFMLIELLLNSIFSFERQRT